MGFLPLSEAPRLLNGFTKSVDVEKLEIRNGLKTPASESARQLPITTAVNQTMNEIILTDARKLGFNNFTESRERILISEVFVLHFKTSLF